MPIRIVVAQSHKQHLDEKIAERETGKIQHFFDTHKFDFKDGTVNVVFVGGEYRHVNRKMAVSCILVNKTDFTISGMSFTMKLSIKDSDAQVASMHTELDEKFLGKLEPDDGVLVRFNFPVIGLSEDRSFAYSGIEGGIEDLLLKKSDEEE